MRRLAEQAPGRVHSRLRHVVQLRVTIFYLTLLRAVLGNAYERTSDGYCGKQLPTIPARSLEEDGELAEPRTPPHFYNESIVGAGAYCDTNPLATLDIRAGVPENEEGGRTLPHVTATSVLLSVPDWRTMFGASGRPLCVAQHVYPLTPADIGRGWVNLAARPVSDPLYDPYVDASVVTLNQYSRDDFRARAQYP